MVRLLVVSAALVVGLANIASAAEGCGANRWRGPDGYCHWFHGPYGSLRGTVFAVSARDARRPIRSPLLAQLTSGAETTPRRVSGGGDGRVFVLADQS